MKWNRLDNNVLASAQGGEVRVWDLRVRACEFADFCDCPLPSVGNIEINTSARIIFFCYLLYFFFLEWTTGA